MRRITEHQSRSLGFVTLLASIGFNVGIVNAQETTDPPKAVDANANIEEASDLSDKESVTEEGEKDSTATSESASDETLPKSDGPSKEDFEALKAEMDALKERQDEAEMNALMADTGAETTDDTFKIYGFMDMGIQRYWADDTALLSALFDTNALTFVLGNVDLYFDFNPLPDWRALAEIRFTNAPHGLITNYGGLAGEFERESTEQFDPHGSAPNAPMWGGRTVIERAWIEWNHYQQARIRTGTFFTPFGIWNVDHGQPTLISIAMPQFIQQNWIPIRQTGVQLLGSVFIDEWEIAYRAWVTNGRQDLSMLDFDDDKAFGARLYVSRQAGDLNLMFGTSYQYTHVRDKVVNITAPEPLRFSLDSTWEYDEHILGFDASVDIGPTRIRSEAIMRYVGWYEGKHAAVGVTSPGSLEPNKYQYAAYLLLAHQLPFWGLEPYLYAELLQQPWAIGDGLITYSGGLNWRFSTNTMLKTQVTRAEFFDWMYTSTSDPSINNVTTFISRLVMAF